MDSTTPKVSFIPKGSLVRETAFLERRRPRSAMGFIAGLVFIASAGSYAGLYFYNGSLEKKVVERTDEINKTQKVFSDAPQVGRAQVFRARAELASDLLGKHTLVSPIFDFLSENTIGSILYEKFSFTRGTDGATVELVGEAPTYASLAYQGDVLRKNTEDISKFDIKNVSLTKFGTVSFVLSLTFTPDFLLYAKNFGDAKDISLQQQDVAAVVVLEQGTEASTVLVTDISSDTSTSTATSTDLSTKVEEDVSPQKTKPSAVVPATEKQSVLRSLWSRFKFW